MYFTISFKFSNCKFLDHNYRLSKEIVTIIASAIIVNMNDALLIGVNFNPSLRFFLTFKINVENKP